MRLDLKWGIIVVLLGRALSMVSQKEWGECWLFMRRGERLPLAQGFQRRSGPNASFLSVSDPLFFFPNQGPDLDIIEQINML